MPRTPMAHILWAKTAPDRHRFSLAESAVDPPDLEAMGLPHLARLPRDGWETLHRLARGLGERLGAPEGTVLVTAGGSEANAAVFLGLLDPGDEMLVERPGYEPHRAVAAWFGARVRPFERVAGKSMAEAVAAAVGRSTRLVMWTDPHNPTGARLSEADHQALEALAARHDLTLVVDETFRDCVEDVPATVAARGARWVSTSTLTKSYGLGGLRIGWVAAAPAWRERVARAHDGLSADPSQPSCALALALLPHLDTLRARSHAILTRHRARLAALAARDPRFATAVMPAVTTFARFGRAAEGDAFAAFASSAFDLAVVPGRFFGDPGGVRIGLGAEPARFDAAFDVLERAAAAFAGSGDSLSTGRSA